MVASSGTAKVTLPADDQILITREFDAPKHLVYRAVTEPELVQQWWGAKHGDGVTAEIDLRVGGKWRYVMQSSDGMEVAFHGEYHEIVENERIVSTEVFEGAPVPDPEAAGTVNTMTLTEVDGRTMLETLIQAPNQDVRDAIIDSGMETGMQSSFDALERVAIELAD